MQRVGLTASGLDALGVGLAEEQGDRLVLVYPRLGDDGSNAVGRMIVSSAGLDDERGPPSAVWSAPPYDGAEVVVCPDPLVMWLMLQNLGASVLAPLLLVARSHVSGVPPRWIDEEYWQRFGSVTLMLDHLDRPDPLRTVLSAMSVIDPGAVTAPAYSTSWQDHLAKAFDADKWNAIRLLLEDPPALRDIVAEAGADTIGRVGMPEASIHDLDDRGRLRRAIAVEERHAVGRPGEEGVRSGLVVIRSDRRMLTIESVRSPTGTSKHRRVCTLSDGDRLSSAPRTGAAARWTLRSAEAWVTRGSKVCAADVASEVSVLFRRIGFATADADVAAAFVMLTYVYPALRRLPLLMLHASSVRERMLAARLLAELCHGGRIVGRDRAKTLARLADEVGGTLVIQDPGPLESPLGLTEIGRFVLSSLEAGASSEHAMGDDGTRTLRTFGPRVICAGRPSKVDWPDSLSLSLVNEAGALRPGYDASLIAGLRDRLYIWSMEAVRELSANAEAIEDGCAALMLLNPGLHGDSAREAGAPAPRASPAEQLEAALEAVRGRNGGVISIVELTLEAALAGGEGDAFTPERIGRWLARSGNVDQDAKPQRRRLYGHITRLYSLDVAGEGGARSYSDPLAFCRQQRCDACRFAGPCARIFPELNAARRRSR